MTEIDPRALAPGRFVQSDDPAIVSFAREAAAGADSRLDAAIRLYYAVRDKVIYDPYVRFAAPETYSAAHVLAAGRGFCIPKAAILAACARAVGIPARLGFADVRNHLATSKLLEKNGGDVFFWHSYAEIMAEDRWVKATPAFNLALCEKFGVHPLEWDGKTDSVFHPFDKQDRRHMEYVGDHGSFYDVPYDEITATYRRNCPALMVDDPWGTGADFAAEAKAEA
jgi:transglutaminase-like putative cysteine protease